MTPRTIVDNDSIGSIDHPDGDTITCPECGEPASENATRIDNKYRGKTWLCMNGECSYHHNERTIAVTVTTLCDHEHVKHVPGQESIKYCAYCGQLDENFGRGYTTRPAPWERGMV